MSDIPSNVKIWGERNDVDTFYAASDMFYFSSKLELNPLSIKESCFCRENLKYIPINSNKQPIKDEYIITVIANLSYVSLYLS